MKLKKMGQTATEYLVILAVIIVIALVVVVAMGKFPGIGKSAVSRGSAAYWSSQDIAVTSYSVNAAGDVVVNVRNNMRNSITLTSFVVGAEELLASPTTLSPGGAISLSGTMATGCTAGQGYAYDVAVDYTDSATSADYTFTGDGNQLEGTCAN